MPNQIVATDFRAALLVVLEETFTDVKGMYLDGGTSMFETLKTISAEEASQPVGGGCASIAAQVNHTAFYLDVAVKYARGEAPDKVDWDGSWDVGPVDGDEWQGLVKRLQDEYEQTRAFAGTYDGWNEDTITGAIALVAHCAYHLGEIRQALCTLKGNRTKAA